MDQCIKKDAIFIKQHLKLPKQRTENHQWDNATQRERERERLKAYQRETKEIHEVRGCDSDINASRWKTKVTIKALIEIAHKATRTIHISSKHYLPV